MWYNFSMNRITKGDKLIQKLEDAGYEAYYVGGCVRDLLMDEVRREGTAGTAAGDIDITTSATPEEMKRVFQNDSVIETGIQHGTLTVLTEDEAGSGKRIPIEITTFRTDGTYSDNRHPDSVVFVRSLKEDLQRRDFTINAIAMDRNGNIQDPFGGMGDIRKRIIRTVGDPDQRFHEDALRIMRAMRFAAVLGSDPDGSFSIDPATEEAMFRNQELLQNVSAERLFTELKKLITGPFAGIVIRRYVDVLGVVIPELLPMKGFDQRNPYHKYDILEHCIRAMEVVQPPNEYMKLTALLHDVGKPDMFYVDENGIGHMHGHAERGEVLVRRIKQRLKADRFMTERVAMLVKYHDLVFQNDERLLKRWMNRYGAEFLLEILHIKRADNIASGNMSHELSEKYDQVEATIHRILETNACFSVRDLMVNGNDVLAIANEDSSAENTGGAGKQKGPWVGEVLDQVLEEVIDGTLPNEREKLLVRIRQIVSGL